MEDIRKEERGQASRKQQIKQTSMTSNSNEVEDQEKKE